MIKRTIEISQNPAHLTVKLDQLLVQPHDQPKESYRSIPCEDIGVVLVDHQQTTYTHAALAKLVEFDAVVIICGRDHLPAGILLPLSDHTRVVWRIHDQLSISKPLQKQLWRQIVQAKVRAQAMNLLAELPQHRRLLAMIDEVRSGDASNIEAQAAKIYWSAWLARPGQPKLFNSGDGSDELVARSTFRRNPDGDDPLNSMLNYGYAVVRAAIARTLVAAGLLPVLGLHHCQRSNAFCLADDLVEPLRPIVDRRVRELYVDHGRRELNQATKAGLLEVLTGVVRVDDQSNGSSVGSVPASGPLMVALHRMVGSLVRCYEGAAKELVIPVLGDGDE